MTMKQHIYSGTAFDTVQKELPQALKDALNKTGWNVFGVYELVKTVLAKEHKEHLVKKETNAHKDDWCDDCHSYTHKRGNPCFDKSINYGCGNKIMDMKIKVIPWMRGCVVMPSDD